MAHLYSLIGSRKAISESRLGYLRTYIHILGVPGQYYSAALMLSYKLDFSCCTNWTVVTNPVTINDDLETESSNSSSVAE